MARAVENQVFVVAASAPANADLTGSHGPSRTINEDGNVLREAGFLEEEITVRSLALGRPLRGLIGA